MTERISRPLYEALKMECDKLLLEKTLWETKARLYEAQVAKLWHQTEQTMHQANNLLEFMRTKNIISIEAYTPPIPRQKEPSIRGHRPPGEGKVDMELNTGEAEVTHSGA